MGSWPAKGPLFGPLEQLLGRKRPSGKVGEMLWDEAFVFRMDLQQKVIGGEGKGLSESDQRGY